MFECFVCRPPLDRETDRIWTGKLHFMLFIYSFISSTGSDSEEDYFMGRVSKHLCFSAIHHERMKKYMGRAM